MPDQNRNLLLRVVTALVLLPLILCSIARGGVPFALLVAVGAALIAIEINQLAARSPLTGAILLRTSNAPEFHEPVSEGVQSSKLGLGALASVLATFLIPILPRLALRPLSLSALLITVTMIALVDALLSETDLLRLPQRVGFAVLAPLYAGLTLSALVQLRELNKGEWWVLLAFVVTWLNDTAAYFAGRAFGRHKLCPQISPNKTWEGAIGGAISSISGAVAMKFLVLDVLPICGAVLIGLGSSVLCPLGDLSESMLKRALGAKDSGKLLPGHGGVLDRFDALLFAAPFVLFCASCCY